MFTVFAIGTGCTIGSTCALASQCFLRKKCAQRDKESCKAGFEKKVKLEGAEYHSLVFLHT
jgi:hypothetical protein